MKRVYSTAISTILLLTTQRVVSTSRTYNLYHSFTLGGPFAPRGSVTLDDSSSNNGGIEASVKHEEECLVDQKESIENMTKDGALYQLKVVEESGGRSVLASVPGCQVRRANFREEIGLTITHTGKILSVSYTPLVSLLAPSTCRDMPQMQSEPKFQTTVVYEIATPAMTLPHILPQTPPPPGLSWYSRNNNDKTFIGEDKQGQSHQSFLRKYWYILLPIAIMMLFGGGDAPPPLDSATLGGRETHVNRVPTTTTSAATMGGESGESKPVTQRRGKRG